jgi:WD40 repeat protein
MTHLPCCSKSHEGFVKRRGNFSRHSPMQTLTCIAPIGHEDSIVSGTTSGQIFLWTDRNCVRTVKGHKGSVISLYSCTHGVLSGGKDCRIRLWTHRLEPGSTFDLSSFGANPVIRSVCMSPDGTSILVGTRACEIYEISAVDGSDLRGGLITSAHSSGCLRGVAVHPKRHEFITVGDDRRLRLWDMNTKTLLKVATFDAEVRCVCYAPLGDVIVVGLGGDPSLPKSGAFAVINEEDLTLVHESKDSVLPITVVKFSPEGETLAVGSEDGSIYLYATQDEYELIGRCVRHTGAVSHIDFSADGEWIRSNSVNGELCFFNSDDASFQSNASAMRDVKWFSNTCVYSWQARGIHRTPFTGEIVTTLTNVGELESANYMIGGTSYGYLTTYAFPCVPQDSEYLRINAHSGEVAGVKFSFNSERLISVGLRDRCVVQWGVKLPPVPEKSIEEEASEAIARLAAGDDAPAVAVASEQKAEEVADDESDDFALEARDGDDLAKEFYVPQAAAANSVLNGLGGDPNTMHPDMDLWLDAMVPPDNPPNRSLSGPDMSIRLDYAYGYRCQDMRNNVRYGEDDTKIVYVCSTVGVVMNKVTKAQNFFQVFSF